MATAFIHIARGAARASRGQFARAASHAATAKAARTAGAAVLTAGALVGGSSYCAWSFWGSSSPDYEQAYKDIAAA